MPLLNASFLTRFLFICLTLFTLTAFAEEPDLPSYANAEHITLGNSIKLYFHANDPGTAKVPLHLPNGAIVTYGDVVSFGDFYGVIGKPISSGATAAQRNTDFINAFNTFAADKSVLPEMDKIRALNKIELDKLTAGMQKGIAPEVIYAGMSADLECQMNCITGGGCGKKTWWLQPGRYLNLERDNFDHFGDDAIKAYVAGHAAAMQQALVAHQSQDRSQLELAYAMNGFASHFLSDRFSAGHIRTPRRTLPAHTEPGLAGELLATYMHSEENINGFHVHNEMGYRWMTYGDWYYFSKSNITAQRMVQIALQVSADEIFYAYLYGDAGVSDKALSYIPIPDELNNQSNIDISPLFYWDADKQKLYRRSDMSNVNDRHWTDNWWGWSTLLELRKERP